MHTATTLFNKSLRVLLITNGSILVSFAMLAPIYAVFVEKIGGDILDANYAYAVFAFAGGVITLVSSRIADVINKKYVIIAGYLLIACGFMGYTQVDSVTELLIVQAIIGTGEAIYSPSFDALYSKHLDSGKYASEWGAWESMNYFCVAFGAIAGGLLVSKFGFDALFVIMGAVSFVSALHLLLLPKKIM
jgi:MFS family permease